MRTTLSIDDDVLETARALAAAQSRPLGAVVSELARRGLAPGPRIATGKYGFPVVQSSGSRRISAQDVADALAEE